MPGTDVNQLIQTARKLPLPRPDGTPLHGGAQRGSRYDEFYSLSPVPSKQLLADEGAYFVATNPVIGTGVAHALVTAFSDTAAVFALKNNDQQPNGRRTFLDYIRLMVTAAPTAVVSTELVIKLDSKDRTPTANNVAVTPGNVNMDDSTQPITLVQAFNAGSLTVPASGPSARTVARIKIPTSLLVVGDVIEIQFGQLLQPWMGLAAARTAGAAPAAFVANAAPVVFGPQQWAVIYRWSLTEATTAPSFEYEIGLFER